MTTWRHDDPFRKADMVDGESWPCWGHYYDQRRTARAVKAARLRRRYWREHGVLLCRIVVRLARALAPAATSTEAI